MTAIDRIRKLMTLGLDRGATQAERDAAVAKARALITEHGIHATDVMRPAPASIGDAFNDVFAEMKAAEETQRAAREAERDGKKRVMYGNAEPQRKPRRTIPNRTYYFANKTPIAGWNGFGVVDDLDALPFPKIHVLVRRDDVVEVTFYVNVKKKSNKPIAYPRPNGPFYRDVTHRRCVVILLRPGEAWAGITYEHAVAHGTGWLKQTGRRR